MGEKGRGCGESERDGVGCGVWCVVFYDLGSGFVGMVPMYYKVCMSMFFDGKRRTAQERSW